MLRGRKKDTSQHQKSDTIVRQKKKGGEESNDCRRRGWEKLKKSKTASDPSGNSRTPKKVVRFEGCACKLIEGG